MMHPLANVKLRLAARDGGIDECKAAIIAHLRSRPDNRESIRDLRIVALYNETYIEALEALIAREGDMTDVAVEEGEAWLYFRPVVRVPLERSRDKTRGERGDKAVL